MSLTKPCIYRHTFGKVTKPFLPKLYLLCRVFLCRSYYLFQFQSQEVVELACIGVLFVRSVKTIVTFAAITSSILVVSWVGLALLGF